MVFFCPEQVHKPVIPEVPCIIEIAPITQPATGTTNSAPRAKPRVIKKVPNVVRIVPLIVTSPYKISWNFILFYDSIWSLMLNVSLKASSPTIS